MSGSSPLARGLPPTASAYSARTGIIPARAGFTDSPRRLSASFEDHPRSRGVYPDRSRPLRAPRGSSPLARGLHAEAGRLCRCLRIIPARAGFTPAMLTAPRRLADHPRSRGVYSESLLVNTGSRRIIPARAGFTHHDQRRAHRGADHPRSRGVYRDAEDREGEEIGSSPLARGLRGPLAVGRKVGGIIPARAGFTPFQSRVAG